MKPPRPRHRALPPPLPNRIRAISPPRSRLSSRRKPFDAPIRKGLAPPGLFPKGLGAKRLRNTATSAIASGCGRIASMRRVGSAPWRSEIDGGNMGFAPTIAVPIGPSAFGAYRAAR
jgi:hypothetical protein